MAEAAALRPEPDGIVRCFAPMTLQPLRRLLTALGVLAARPFAFYAVALYCALWVFFDRASLGWSGVATIATLLMTLIIQRAEHRDTQAIHAKLDSLLLTHEKADSELSSIDKMQPEEIEQIRADTQADAGL